jgi:hypothetical protein
MVESVSREPKQFYPILPQKKEKLLGISLKRKSLCFQRRISAPDTKACPDQWVLGLRMIRQQIQRRRAQSQSVGLKRGQALIRTIA